MPTTAEVISYAKTSQHLALCEINTQKYLNGGALDERLSRLLYIVRNDVEFLCNLDPSDSTLSDTTNYLYALCGKYALEAQYLQGNNGGNVLPTPINNMVYTSVKIPTTGVLTVPFVHPLVNLGNAVTEGTAVLEIRDVGIQEASFFLFSNGQKVDEGLTDQFSYTHDYINNIFTVILNAGLQNNQRLEMRYGKTNPV